MIWITEDEFARWTAAACQAHDRRLRDPVAEAERFGVGARTISALVGTGMRHHAAVGPFEPQHLGREREVEGAVVRGVHDHDRVNGLGLRPAELPGGWRAFLRIAENSRTCGRSNAFLELDGKRAKH